MAHCMTVLTGLQSTVTHTGENFLHLWGKSSYDLGHKGWKNSFYIHFASPQPCAMLTKHFDLDKFASCYFPTLKGE